MMLTWQTLAILSVSWWLAAVITWWCVPRVIAWYQRYRWDMPHQGRRQNIKDTHQGVVPRGGGIAIMIGILTAALVLLTWDLQLIAIIIGAMILTVVGWLDDVYDLSPFIRLIVNVLVAIMIVRAGMTIDFITNPFGSGVLALTSWPWLPPTLTVFYIVALTNITNWAKGIDGQMPGTVAMAAMWIGVLALRLTAGINQTAILSLIVAGSFSGFLYWNFYPQKIMPGYGGGSLAGFLLSVLSIMAGAKIATLFMVLALPIADAIFTVMRRTIAGKSIFLGDRGHLHHKLLDRLHWGRRRIAVFYWGVTLLMGVLAQILPTWGKIVAFLLVTVGVFAFLIWMKISATSSILRTKK